MINHITQNAIAVSDGHNACLKQSVYAMITTVDGQVVYGSNKMLNDVEVCPRETAGCVSGEGYDMCKDICAQNAHAEPDAIQTAIKAKLNIRGATLTLVGHTYCCDDCTRQMKLHGIKLVNIMGADNTIATSIEL